MKVARPTVHPFGLDVGCDIFHPKGGFPVRAEITRILAANIRGNFSLLSPLQRVLAV